MCYHMDGICGASRVTQGYRCLNKILFTIIHVICPVNCRAHIKPVRRVLDYLRIFYWKLGSFCKWFVQCDVSLSQFLLNNLALYQLLCLSKIVHRLHNLTISWNDLFLNVEFLRSDAILCPC